MKRVLLAKFNHEVGSFNPRRTYYGDFAIHRGADLLAAARSSNSTLAGNIDVLAARPDIELVPTWGAWCNTTGGLVAEPDMERLIGELLAAIAAHAPADAVCLSLHGAMAGESEADPEGRVVSGIRDIVGDVPIVAAMDLHAVLSQRLIEAADALVFLHTYPHTDMRDTGQRAARLLLRQLDGQVKPTTARVPIPLLARGDELITASGYFGRAISRCQAIEASAGGLAAGVVIGNPFTDVPDLQSNALVTTDDDPAQAHALALELARFMWENRARWLPKLTPLEQAVRLAQATDGLTVFSDAADSTASGASGDSNAILQGLLQYNYGKRALIPIVDAPAVEAAYRTGVGGQFTGTLGGTIDRARFAPVELPLYVKSLSDGAFTTEFGDVVPPSRTAILTSGSLTLLVTQEAVPIVGRKVYQSQGHDPADYDLVVCKSPNGFRTHYEAIAARIVAVDVPGSTSANLKTLPYQQCVRPIFPLDDAVVPPFAEAD